MPSPESNVARNGDVPDYEQRPEDVSLQQVAVDMSDADATQPDGVMASGAADGAPAEGAGGEAEDDEPQPPAPRWGFAVTITVLSLALSLAGFSAVIGRLVLQIRDGCFFEITGEEKDWDRFKATGLVCDAPPWVNWLVGWLVGLDAQVSFISCIVPYFPGEGSLVAIGLGGNAAWTCVRLLVTVIFAAIGMPFRWYVLPAIVATVAGVVLVLLMLPVYAEAHAFAVVLRKHRLDKADRDDAIAANNDAGNETFAAPAAAEDQASAQRP
jgi:hypothetical protein